MQIEIHGLVIVIHGMLDADIIELFSILGIPIDVCNSKIIGNSKEWTHSFAKAKESIFIRVNVSYVLMVLNGSFFDNSPEFRLRKLLKFLCRFKHTFKQLDVAFTDDQKFLVLKHIKYWCKHSDDYCTGSLVARQPPLLVTAKGKFVRIQLHSAQSKTNFGTIYRRPDTKFIRIEIKIKNNNKIEYVLENYSGKNLEQFHTRCRELLVSCINFITTSSKKNRVASKYKKQAEWEAFLESDVKKIKWSEVHRLKLENRQQSDIDFFDKKIKRQATMVNNMINKLTVMRPEEDIKKLFAGYSGYQLIETDKPCT